ncbi:MAG: DUF2330 domain-containing protein [Chloroflexota bacterium]|nr:DUF2330 domain-containing protein [Chloroflexota bacterium]
MRRFITTPLAVLAALLFAAIVAGPHVADACAGLIGSNGAVNLARTSTLAAYHDGVEHYVTAFQFQGGGGQFGTLIPLPGEPSKVERGGGWTLQRLAIETRPPQKELAFALAANSAGSRAQVLQQVRIDALDITVLKGGGPDVAAWAQEHGFHLSPDAPEVLDFYANRSPIFLAAVFDGDAASARGQQVGDGTPVHITIPTSNPWVPLRILGLGKQPLDRVDADVYLLTDNEPALLPAPGEGTFGTGSGGRPIPPLALTYNQQASKLLLDDLRADAGMSWVPQSGWLTRLQVDSAVSDLRFDLAVDATGRAAPSPVAAGLEPGANAVPRMPAGDGLPASLGWLTLAGAGLVFFVIMLRRRPRADLP